MGQKVSENEHIKALMEAITFEYDYARHQPYHHNHYKSFIAQQSILNGFIKYPKHIFFWTHNRRSRKICFFEERKSNV